MPCSVKSYMFINTSKGKDTFKFRIYRIICNTFEKRFRT